MELLFIYTVPALIAVAAVVLLLYARQRYQKGTRLLHEAKERSSELKKELEAERRESNLKIKDEIYRRRKEFEAEAKREKLELDRVMKRLETKEEDLDKKEDRLEEMRTEAQQKERELLRMQDSVRAHESKLRLVHTELTAKLEQVSGMTRDDAKQVLMQTIESDVRYGAEKWIQKVEEDARQSAKERVSQILVTAMQRYTAEQVSPHSSGVVHLPNEEMKGRIIGKEGRNIKALEMSTGMEFVIGETPEIITISGFNPIRREVARRSLEKLIQDGRINPTRIEETVIQCEKEIDEMIQEYGKQSVLEFNLQGVNTEIQTLLGKLYFRTSYSQNVLTHSKEVALFARMIAEELGLDPDVALRGGLFHDIGKALTAEIEGPHALIGADVIKRAGEDARVVNAVAAHHEEVPYISIYSPIIVIADTISASRPGARRETFAAYVKRLEKLEEIAHTFEGVKRAFALQAGREIRVIVEEELMDDERTLNLARDIARKVETQMNFPGQIKVNVIREKRAVEYAR
jgi:ribonuclease Y